MDVIKVHQGLDSVARDKGYHLGHYEVDFQDGSLRFQVFARICDNLACFCDNLLLEWTTEQSNFKTWYDDQRNLRDENQKALPAEMEGVFRIVETTDTFQERVKHLLYLRRRQVLEENERNGESFRFLIPNPLLLEGHNVDEGILGSLRARVKGQDHFYRFGMDVCSDTSCFCDNLFLNVVDHEDLIQLLINASDDWSPVEDNPDNRRFTTRIKTRAMGSEKFRKLLAHFRLERRLQNYHRYVQGYPEMMRARAASAT